MPRQWPKLFVPRTPATQHTQDESKQYISQNPCSDYLKKALFVPGLLDRLLNFPWNLKIELQVAKKHVCFQESIN